ncbi:MarR family transcriptional regulator [Oceanobacillus chungangensis]|uniref:MarR family transcriptional regulator n=2 Tax=Oceanobacillus chungangensis TaxID=1229152 RepID=A0A3D8PST1_9BACI|nr:MarR family transcriptional regulator [Oceanobacillus chungangensis]
MKPYQLFFHHYHKMYRPFVSKLNVHLAKHQLHSSQWSALVLLKNEGPLTIVEIASHQNVEKPTISRTVKRLVELGFVEQTPGKDKREKRIEITRLGEAVCTEIRETVEQFEVDALQGISEEEQIAVSRILATVYENLRK